MNGTEDDNRRHRGADGWMPAGEFLEEARRPDLTAMDEAAGRNVLRRLSSAARPASPARSFPGPVEQQRLYRRLAPR